MQPQDLTPADLPSGIPLHAEVLNLIQQGMQITDVKDQSRSDVSQIERWEFNVKLIFCPSGFSIWGPAHQNET